MSKKIYQYNPSTLQFEAINKSCKSKILRFTITILSGISIILIFSYIYSRNFITIKQKRLTYNNLEILSKYNDLNQEVDTIRQKISVFADRDDLIYRAVFEQEPLPASLRNAGTGGTKKYERFEKYENSDILINTYKSIDNLLNRLRVQSSSYDDITELAVEKEKLINGKPGIQPLSIKDFIRISSFFGFRADPISGCCKKHNGLDFTGPVNANIYATGDGTVVLAGNTNNGYGNEIIINHFGGYSTRYAHLNKIYIKEGQVVTRGELIGSLGNTGKSTGPHLHYEVMLDGEPLNPINFYYDNLSYEEYEQITEYSKNNNSSEN